MITELPADLLQRIFACVLGARGGGRSIPAVCRQWRAAWEDDALWASPALQRALGSPSTRQAAAAARASFRCGWVWAWRAATDLRRTWERGGVPLRRKQVVGDSDGLTSLDGDAAFGRIAVGCFARDGGRDGVQIFALPASARDDGSAVTGLRQLCRLPCHADTVWDVRWHGEEQLLTASFDCTMALHDAAAAPAEGDAYEPLLTLAGHTDRVMGVASCGPHLAASAGRDGAVKRWDLRAGRCVATLRLDDEAQRCVYSVIRGEGEHGLLSGHDGAVAHWDCRANALLETVAAHTRMVMDLQLDAELGCLATASRDDTAKLWRWPSLECAAVLSGQVGVRSIQFDSDKVVTAANDRTVSVWKFPPSLSRQGQLSLPPFIDNPPTKSSAASTRRLAASLEPEPEPEPSSSDDEAAARPSTPPQARPVPDGAPPSSLSPLRTAALAQRPLHTLRHTAQVPRARFRGGVLASACVDRCIRVWDFAGWEPPKSDEAAAAD